MVHGGEYRPAEHDDPHAVIAPDASSAAKAMAFEKTSTKPLPVGAPLPP